MGESKLVQRWTICSSVLRFNSQTSVGNLMDVTMYHPWYVCEHTAASPCWHRSFIWHTTRTGKMFSRGPTYVPRHFIPRFTLRRIFFFLSTSFPSSGFCVLYLPITLTSTGIFSSLLRQKLPFCLAFCVSLENWEESRLRLLLTFFFPPQNYCGMLNLVVLYIEGPNSLPSALILGILQGWKSARLFLVW